MKESGKTGIELNKFNLEIVLKSILWYGSGYHSRNTSIPFKVVKEIFEISSAKELQHLYNLIDLNSEEIGVYMPCFADNTIEMYKLEDAPVAVLNVSRSLAMRSIVYSLKDDLDEVSLGVSDFMNDLL